MDPFVYQYAVGGVVFGFGLTVGWKQGYLGPRGLGLRRLIWLLLGLGFFMALQGFLEYAPMSSRPAVEPVGGRPKPVVQLGSPLDTGIMVGYFLLILAVGAYYGRDQKNTKDYFFAGQRFSWWIIAFSLTATTIGSYSFVKYSKIAYGYGIASSQTYLNDWFWLPLLIFGWLPLLYFSKLRSIPEYYERRFGTPARRAVTVLLLVYLIGYVGVNLFTMGKALNILVGWPIPLAAMLVAGVSAGYVTMGGQASVIMTDLLQGVMLLIVGLVILALGVDAVGGLEAFWELLPRGHRRAFVSFNEDPAYHSAGIFWQDAMANSAMFYFLNQGILMRFMAARSVHEGRRAVVAVLIVLMPISAMVVASGGWVAKALDQAGMLPALSDGGQAFFVATSQLAQPGLFGLVMAALTAALMSTVDTLITAVSAIVVNDIYRPLRPQASDADQLRIARLSSLSVAVLGVALVPVFMGFDSIYAAHGAFTAAVTPPLVVSLLMGVFWRRFTSAAALAVLIGGGAAIVASLFVPALIAPFAHGVPAVDVGEGLFAGVKQYKFMRALYGLSVCAVIGVVVTLCTRPRDPRELAGLVSGTVGAAIEAYKGAPGVEAEGPRVRAKLEALPAALGGPGEELPGARVSRGLAERAELGLGDLLVAIDARPFQGGLRCCHARVAEIEEGAEPRLSLDQGAHAAVLNPGAEVAVQRLL